MVCRWFESSVTVTNEKTGDSVTITDHNRDYRSTHKRKDLAIKMLRSRQWAIENGYGPSTEEVACL